MIRRSRISSCELPDDPEDLDSPEAIEAGSLTIENDESKPVQNELWERPPFHNLYALPHDGSSLLRFEILTARMMPPNGEDLKVKRYVVYDLTVRLDSKFAADSRPAVIKRRYTDFRELYIKLRRDHPVLMSRIDFPNKVLMGNFSATLIAERGASFETFLNYIVNNETLKQSPEFLHFLQNNELTKACQLMDERNDSCVPILENSFLLLNKIFMDRSKPVLLLLCRLVAACTSCTPMPHESAERWAALALNRYETLSDIDLLPLYIPLLNTCAHLWWQQGHDQKPITDRLTDMSKKGISINNVPNLIQAIHKLDPRSETI
uniref:PX domain-containing protein n=1 Tax=Glossina morsitans morsitans TaxID=37546 RepID=A0A1B0FQX7_GLOMM